MTFFFSAVFIILVFWRPQEWLMQWMFGWPVLDAIVVLALFTLVIETDSGRLKFPKNLPQVYLVFGLWFACMASHAAHTYFEGLANTIVPTFKYCFFCYLLFCVLDRPSRLRRVAQIFVFMSCFMAIHAIMQQKTGAGFGGLRPIKHWRPEHGEVFRSIFYGIFNDPNDLAQMLAVSIPLAFTITKRRNLISLLTGVGISYLLIRGMNATYSRGGEIALMGVGAAMILLALPTRWLLPMLGLGLFGALVAAPFSGGIMDAAGHERVILWGEANFAFKTSPVFGVGWSMINDYMPRDMVPHNAFVSCYAEIGVFGYWFWFGLILLGILGAYRSRVALKGCKDPEGRWLHRFSGLSIAAMIGFCGSAYFLSRTFIYPVFFLIAILGVQPLIAMRYVGKQRMLYYSNERDVFLLNSVGTMFSIVYVYFSILILNKVFYG